jgi:tripartite-type tricarboxylate transporter receptor subunit TctC
MANRPITLIVPYGAGGPLDILTRIVRDRMRVPLGQSLVIENVTGASGTVGVGRAARSAPDGNTRQRGQLAHARRERCHLHSAIRFAGRLRTGRTTVQQSLVMVARTGLKDLKELIAYLRDNPDKVTSAPASAAAGHEEACQLPRRHAWSWHRDTGLIWINACLSLDGSARSKALCLQSLQRAPATHVAQSSRLAAS